MLTSNNEIKWQVVSNIKFSWGEKIRKYKKKQILKIQESVIKQQLTTLDNLFLPHNQKERKIGQNFPPQI